MQVQNTNDFFTNFRHYNTSQYVLNKFKNLKLDMRQKQIEAEIQCLQSKETDEILMMLTSSSLNKFITQ